MFCGRTLRVSMLQTLWKFLHAYAIVTKGHHVVQEEAYKRECHPGYLGDILMFMGAGLAIVNWLAAIRNSCDYNARGFPMPHYLWRKYAYRVFWRPVQGNIQNIVGTCAFVYWSALQKFERMLRVCKCLPVVRARPLSYRMFARLNGDGVHGHPPLYMQLACHPLHPIV